MIEGITSSGKSTVIKYVVKELRKKNYTVEVFDLESGEHAEDLKRVADDFESDDPVRMFTLWVMRLEQSKSVKDSKATIKICNRFWGSMLANDVHGNKVPPELVEQIIKQYMELPAVTIILDVPLSIAKYRDRRANRKSRTLRNKTYARRIIRGYRTLVKKYKWHQVDANRDPEEVGEDCLKIILEYIEKNHSHSPVTAS